MLRHRRLARTRFGSIEPALYWDVCDPYHYVRLQPDESREGRRGKTGEGVIQAAMSKKKAPRKKTLGQYRILMKS